MKRRAWLWLLLFAVGCKAPHSEPLRVAAAADLAHAFAELAPAFNAQSSTPVDLKLSLGATGLLARQITQGAPFDLFLAANVSYVEQVVKAGACDGESVAKYARGRLVIWVKGAGGAELTPASLSDARFKHIAIANPEHAPYGKAAREALTHAGVWSQVSQRTVYGENVQQAFELAQSGNADVAIVGLSLAIGTAQGSWAMVDEASYAPIDQALVVCKHGTNAAGARRLKAFLEAPAGRTILRKFGFLMPGESWALAP
ncbi:MAG TPA: molybdate ABC transporter substrate-binding protein [Polyangiaceae bacterium]|nr:molybdate ABC transporter substrate-binding protein [Polyangiaceae bacterium]